MCRTRAADSWSWACERGNRISRSRRVDCADPHEEREAAHARGVEHAPADSAAPTCRRLRKRVPGYEFGGWQAIFTPAGTPQEIVARLHGGTLKAISAQEFKDYLFREGSDLVGSTPAELASFLRADVEKNPRPDQRARASSCNSLVYPGVCRTQVDRLLEMKKTKEGGEMNAMQATLVPASTAFRHARIFLSSMPPKHRSTALCKRHALH